GLIAQIDTPALTSKLLLQWIEGPDYPPGVSIIVTEETAQAFTKGRGAILQRGDATIVQLQSTGRRQSRTLSVITSHPYLVGPESFAKKVDDLVREEKLTGNSDVNDETDSTRLRVVIELKRDAHPEVVLNQVYKYTQLQQSFPVNTLALKSVKR